MNIEILKLIASFLVPLVLAVFGVYIHRITKRFELTQWRSQKLIEKRLAIYDDLAPDLNDLLCYFTYVGLWRDIDPPEIVKRKRSIDKKIYLAAPLFSSKFFDACQAFQNHCYQTFNGMGEDAKLKTAQTDRANARKADWNPEWSNCFANEVTDRKEIRTAYNNLMSIFSEEIGVNINSVANA